MLDKTCPECNRGMCCATSSGLSNKDGGESSKHWGFCLGNRQQQELEYPGQWQWQRFSAWPEFWRKNFTTQASNYTWQLCHCWVGFWKYSKYSIFLSNDDSAVFAFQPNSPFSNIHIFKAMQNEFFACNSTILAPFCSKCIVLEETQANLTGNCKTAVLGRWFFNCDTLFPWH